LAQQVLNNNPNNNDISFLNELIFNEKKNDTTGVMKMANSIIKVIEKGLENSSQIVLTGAPGTGKTYSVLEYVKLITGNDNNRYNFVQFHSSYDYTDFVEGLRPAVGEDGKNTFVRMDGTFKAFCRKVMENNLEYLEYSLDDDGFELFKKSLEDYEGISDYEEALKTKYFFIIDEINRAELSKVFGELMYGLEESYRGVKNAIPTQYANLPTYKIENKVAKELEFDCYKNGFFIPENVIIIGTMNDIDRSVDTFDFALRRRFLWINIDANEYMEDTLKQMVKDKTIDLNGTIDKIKNMNDKIAGFKGLSSAFEIGAAYFKNLGKMSLQSIFDEKIKPILIEYTRGRKDSDQLIKDCADSLGVIA